MARMRIAHVLPYVTSGGPERRALMVLEHGKRHIADHHLYCSELADDMKERFESLGSQIHPIETRWNPWRMDVAFTMALSMWRARVDVIHAGVFEGVVMAAAAHRILLGLPGKKPRLVLEENSGALGRSPKARLLFRTATLQADRVIGVSRQMASRLVQEERVPERKVQTILNAVSISTVALESRDELDRRGVPRGRFVIGTVCRLSERFKRVSLLLRMMQHLPADEFHLLIVGAGHDEADLKERACELGVQGSVTFWGYARHPESLYPHMDVFALPSRSESFGLVLAEAMHFGLPCLATAVGGIPEVVVDQHTGFLLQPDPFVFADRARQLRDDPSLYKQMSEAGFRVARERFSQQRYVKEICGLYESLLGDAHTD